jgi:hypothetical protein
MLAAASCRFFVSWAGNGLGWLLRVMAIGALVCLLWAPVGRADESRRTGEAWPFDRAAMEIRRLPPTGSPYDGHGSEINDPPAAIRALPVSASTVLESNRHQKSGENPSSDSGTRLYLGYDRGFVIAADRAAGDDAASVDFLMRVNSWLHFRHTLFDSDGPNEDQNTFSFERLRLVFSGHAFSPDLGYFFQLDGNSDSSTDATFLDYYVTYDLGHNVFGCEEDKLGVKVGKWKVPFSRSREEAGRRLQFTDRATANVFFDLNRSIGAGVYGQLDHFSMPLRFETAVFNGFRTDNDSTNRANGELDSNFAWSLRSYTDLFSDFGEDGEPDLSWHVLPALRVGGGLAYTRVDEEGSSEFRRLRVVDSGARLASILPPGVSAYDIWYFTVETHLKYRGFSVIADYYWRYITQFSGGSVPSLYDDGFVLQTGYFICPKRLELLFRWSRIVGDSGTLGLEYQSSDEVATGFVWYIKGHNAKLTFDVSHFNGTPFSEARLDILPGDVGWLYRTQFQLAF